MKVRKLNGTTLEGGGQLVRLSVCLSALTGKPIQIHNIRGKRDGGGGLKEQHLSCVKWLAQACDADTEGMVRGSRVLNFAPGRRRDGWWEAEKIEKDGRALAVRSTSVFLATSGAVTLVLQAILPFMLFAGAEDGPRTGTTFEDEMKYQMQNLSLHGKESPKPDPILLTLHGGTNVMNSPSIDYLTQVLLPNFKLLGLPSIELLNDRRDLKRRLNRGWATGHSSIGTASLLIQPIPQGSTLPALTYPPRGTVTKFTITILAPHDLRDYLQRRTIDELLSRLAQPNKAKAADIEVLSNEDSGNPKRIHVLVVAHTTSGFRLGCDCLFNERIGQSIEARREAADRLVDKAVTGLEDEIASERCVDEWMEDQLVVFQALARGRSGVASVTAASRDAQTGPETEDDGYGDGDGDGDGREACEYVTGGKHASLHTRTVRWVVSELLGVEFDDEGACEGAAYVVGNGITGW